MKFSHLWRLLICFLIICCKNKNTAEDGADSPEGIFTLLTAKETGVDFVNEVVDRENFNILTYRNFYNGGGCCHWRY